MTICISYAYNHQDGTSTHTAHASMELLSNILQWPIISKDAWPLRSLHLLY